VMANRPEDRQREERETALDAWRADNEAAAGLRAKRVGSHRPRGREGEGDRLPGGQTMRRRLACWPQREGRRGDIEMRRIGGSDR
jgi:hypothetical protein